MFNSYPSTLTMNNATFYGNSATTRGASLSNHNGSTGSAVISNTILVGAGTSTSCHGTVTSQGYNLSNDSSCSLNATGDLHSVANALLGPRSDNGGPTKTHALLPGSPAVDAGSSSQPGSGGYACAATDQRGDRRLLLGGRCDIGAYELSKVVYQWDENSTSSQPTAKKPGTEGVNRAGFDGDSDH